MKNLHIYAQCSFCSGNTSYVIPVPLGNKERSSEVLFNHEWVVVKTFHINLWLGCFLMCLAGFACLLTSECFTNVCLSKITRQDFCTAPYIYYACHSLFIENNSQNNGEPLGLKPFVLAVSLTYFPLFFLSPNRGKN